MKEKTTPLSRQSLLDIALQTGGSTEAAFDLAETNDISISEPLETGVSLQPTAVADQKVIDRYEAADVRPATELSPEDIEMAPYGGIGYMGIEVDFVVS